MQINFREGKTAVTTYVSFKRTALCPFLILMAALAVGLETLVSSAQASHNLGTGVLTGKQPTMYSVQTQSATFSNALTEIEKSNSTYYITKKIPLSTRSATHNELPTGGLVAANANIFGAKLAGEDEVSDTQVKVRYSLKKISQHLSTLHQAVQAGDLTAIDRELASGTDINARDQQGLTALMYAVKIGNKPVVEKLLSMGTDVNLKAPDGATLLHMASSMQRQDIVSLLMLAYADGSVQGPGGTASEVARKTFGRNFEL